MTYRGALFCAAGGAKRFFVFEALSVGANRTERMSKRFLGQLEH